MKYNEITLCIIGGICHRGRQQRGIYKPLFGVVCNIESWRLAYNDQLEPFSV